MAPIVFRKVKNERLIICVGNVAIDVELNYNYNGSIRGHLISSQRHKKRTVHV